MILTTKQFTLRPITLTDAKGYLETHLNKEAKKAFTSVPTTLKEAKKELQQQLAEIKANKRKTWAITIKDEFAGFISLHNLTTHPRYKHTAIIGYGIHKNHRNKGLATKALKKITSYGFKELGLKRITGMCRTHNKASQNVLAKAGYKLEGILKKNKFMNGKYVDDMLWAKTK